MIYLSPVPLSTPIILLNTICKVPKTALSLKQLQPAPEIVAGDKGDQGQQPPTAAANPPHEHATGTGWRSKFPRNIKHT